MSSDGSVRIPFFFRVQVNIDINSSKKKKNIDILSGHLNDSAWGRPDGCIANNYSYVTADLSQDLSRHFPLAHPTWKQGHAPWSLGQALRAYMG